MINSTRKIDITSETLVNALLRVSETECVCLLDSCGVGHLGSHLLIAGIESVEVIEIDENDPQKTLGILDEKFSDDLASIFTLSYELGNKLLNIASDVSDEPDVFLARFGALIVHDYDSDATRLVGDAERFDRIESKLKSVSTADFTTSSSAIDLSSNFDRDMYLAAIDVIKERIRRGDTYQTNLTHQLRVSLPDNAAAQAIFAKLRKDHPAPFAAFITRENSSVISASPERFFKIENGRITTSPIKGTRPRGKNASEDDALKNELLLSEKDLAENTMIVDLLRNDLGRVCEYGSVRVEKLCDLEEHPSLFHLVSTISGQLKKNTQFSDILTALFPCGSITGAPKISTMKIIDEIEKTPRGLSMGAIGYHIPEGWGMKGATFDLSVAIRTMVVSNGVATFNVGGGIVIDSDPEKEWEETLVKAKALLRSLSAEGLLRTS